MQTSFLDSNPQSGVCLNGCDVSSIACGDREIVQLMLEHRVYVHSTHDSCSTLDLDISKHDFDLAIHLLGNGAI